MRHENNSPNPPLLVLPPTQNVPLPKKTIPYMYLVYSTLYRMELWICLQIDYDYDYSVCPVYSTYSTGTQTKSLASSSRPIADHGALYTGYSNQIKSFVSYSRFTLLCMR